MQEQELNRVELLVHINGVTIVKKIALGPEGRPVPPKMFKALVKSMIETVRVKFGVELAEGDNFDDPGIREVNEVEVMS